MHTLTDGADPPVSVSFFWNTASFVDHTLLATGFVAAVGDIVRVRLAGNFSTTCDGSVTCLPTARLRLSSDGGSTFADVPGTRVVPGIGFVGPTTTYSPFAMLGVVTLGASTNQLEVAISGKVNVAANGRILDLVGDYTLEVEVWRAT